MIRFIFLLLIIFLGCTQQTGKKNVELKSEQVSISPTIFTINPDSLKTFTPGLEGFRKPIVKKADHSNKQVLTGPRKIIPGISYLIQSKEDIARGAKAVMSKKPVKFILDEEPIINTPGINGFDVPVEYEISDPVEIDLENIRDFRKYIIENNWYSIQNNDTILPPLLVSAKYSPPIKAKAPSFKDNSILDIKYLDIAHGLPSSNIYSVLESKSGDIWMGSHGEGIVRYNGETITSFGIEHGLNHGMVEEIIEDKKGNIWIVTSGNGVACYDGDTFTWYTTDQGLLSNTAWAILESKNGDIWIGTSDGVSKIDGQHIVNYTTRQGLLTNEVRRIGEDTQNNIWFASQEMTLFDGEKFKIYPSEIFSTHYFIRIKEDSRGNLWVATVDNGVFIFDGDTITHFSVDQGFTNALVYDICEDSKGNLWFSTYKDGLYKFDFNTLHAMAGFTHFTEDHGLSGNIIIDIIEDSGGNLCLATAEGGISIFNPNGFYHLTEDQGLLFNKVNTIKEDADGTIWLAGWGGGLIKIYGDSISHYTQKEGMVYSRKEAIFYNWIYDISFDHSGNIWATTEYGPLIGLSYFDHNTITNYQFASYYWDPVIPHILFMSSAVDAEGNTWFGTSKSGILKFDDHSGTPKFTQYVFKELEGVPIRVLHFDQNNNLWIGTEGNGFYIYDGIDFRNYTVENGLVSMEVNSIYESKNGEMWIATQNGLSRFDENSNFTNYTTEEGLISNDIKSITQDNNDNYWITTNKGVSLMTSDNKTIYNFNRQNGLIGVNFRPKSGMIDSRNKIWWGNNKAITALDLNTFEIPEKAPKLTISQVFINGKNHDYKALLASGSDTSGIEFSAVEPFSNLPENLELDYRNHHLTFNYYAIDWKAPHQLKYQYILEGEDEDWSELTDKNDVTYGNLPYGNYTFKVKAIGAAHKWSETLEYSFLIHPPWWHTWWARTIYGLLFILLMLGIIRIRTNILLNQRKHLRDEVEKRTLELKNTQAQLIQSEKMASLGQLTAGIAHEINNPVGFTQTSSFALDQDLKDIKQLIDKYRSYIQNSKDDVSEIEDFEKSIDYNFLIEAINQSIADIIEGTKRTSEIVKGLREFSHIDSEQMEPADIHYGIDSTLKLLKSKFIKGIKLTKNYDQSIGMIDCHIGQMNQVFMNLLINAIDAIEEKGEIVITTKAQDNNVLISFEDDGHGINEELINKIFDPFFTTKEIGEGMGLGLSISHGIIENHGGTIAVKSTPGKGTRFDIVLPGS